MPADRDPRIDPRAGDAVCCRVLRAHGYPDTVVYLVTEGAPPPMRRGRTRWMRCVAALSLDLAERFCSQTPCLDSRYSLTTWRNLTRGATILAREGVEEPADAR